MPVFELPPIVFVHENSPAVFVKDEFLACVPLAYVIVISTFAPSIWDWLSETFAVTITSLPLFIVWLFVERTKTNCFCCWLVGVAQGWVSAGLLSVDPQLLESVHVLFCWLFRQADQSVQDQFSEQVCCSGGTLVEEELPEDEFELAEDADPDNRGDEFVGFGLAEFCPIFWWALQSGWHELQAPCEHELLHEALNLSGQLKKDSLHTTSLHLFSGPVESGLFGRMFSDIP